MNALVNAFPYPYSCYYFDVFICHYSLVSPLLLLNKASQSSTGLPSIYQVSQLHIYQAKPGACFLAFDIGGLGFEFCVFVTGWRHTVRSEWPYITTNNNNKRHASGEYLHTLLLQAAPTGCYGPNLAINNNKIAIIAYLQPTTNMQNPKPRAPLTTCKERLKPKA